MEITENDIRKIADIARVKITKAETCELADNIKRIINYVKSKLDEFDIKDNIEIEHFTNLENVFREDIPESFFLREDIMANAPDSEDGYFRVPKVLPWV